MAYITPNSFYSSFAKRAPKTGFKPYQAPRSSAFGGSLGSAPKTATSAPVTASSGGGSASGPATPPQGFTVTPLNLPPDPVYQQTMGTLGTGLTDTLAGIGQARTAGLQQYGYTEDPTTHAIAYDPNNPYSQAALLRKNYQQAKTGNTTSYAAAGQLYAGSLQNAQDKATNDFNFADNNLTRAVINFLANNTQAATTAQDNYNTAAGQALGTSVQNAPNNPLYNPSAGGSGAVYSTDANGNAAITAGPGGSALVPQQANSIVKLAGGWSVLLDANGNAIKFIPPGG